MEWPMEWPFAFEPELLLSLQLLALRYYALLLLVLLLGVAAHYHCACDAAHLFAAKWELC